MTKSFLCGHCKGVMCTDCIQIAEEYQEIEIHRKRDLITANHEIERLTAELAAEKRRSAMLEEVAKAGLPEIITAWMDKEFSKLLK